MKIDTDTSKKPKHWFPFLAKEHKTMTFTSTQTKNA